MTKSLAALAICLSAGMITSAPARAQSVEASLVGVVRDTSGAVVRGAAVSATQMETGFVRRVTTTQDGAFEIPALPTGPYEVRVTQSDFKEWVRAGVVLSVGQRVRIEPVLEVGDVRDQLTVMAEPTVLQTEKAEIGTTIQAAEIAELPLSGRRFAQLAEFAPGVRVTRLDNYQRIQGNGVRSDMTEFQINNMNSNAMVNEDNAYSPPLDSISEFRVVTANFSAQNGRMPMAVNVSTKAGTNSYRGSVWDFFRHDALDARNAFALTTPKLRHNQFGFTIGGPVRRNRTFFFVSGEQTNIRTATIFNSTVVSPEFLEGNFSSLLPGLQLVDPVSRQPFTGNIIPPERFNPAATYFFPYLLLPNSPDGRFRANAEIPNDAYNGVARIDHVLTNRQNLYAHFGGIYNILSNAGYDPIRHLSVQRDWLKGNNMSLTYNYALRSNLLVSAQAGYAASNTGYDSNGSGVENLTAAAGIQGFPTEGRESHIGLPDVRLNQYAGFRGGGQAPGESRTDVVQTHVTTSWLRNRHSITGGWYWTDRASKGNHGSCCPQGVFAFNGQYSGDAFADYLLGYAAATNRNFPLQPFGLLSGPYTALYLQDYWQVSDAVTLNLGVRWDYWGEKKFRRGARATYDPVRAKIVAGTLDNGTIDMGAQETTPSMYAQYQQHIITAGEVGLPPGAWVPAGGVAPRLGVTWRPLASGKVVLRGGYGVFYSAWGANSDASAIVGPPYWSIEGFSLSAANPVDWRVLWPAEQRFSNPNVTGVDAHTKPQISHETNVAVQTLLPYNMAVEVAYVSNISSRLQTFDVSYNSVPPGSYSNLQAARPFPDLGQIALQVPAGKSWYHALQTKVERRLTNGLSFGLAYALGKTTDNSGSGDISINTMLAPFAPPGYNDGLSTLHRRHVLTAHAVYHLPVGRDRTFGSGMPAALDAVLGGWEIAGIYRYRSGAPLNILANGASLGNGMGTRADLVGDPDTSNPSAQGWFNTDAFSQPDPFVFGTSPRGVVIGPGLSVLDLNVSKNFRVWGRRLQFRWEMFNALNHVNLGDPFTTIGFPTLTGRIFSAGPARSMQIGLRFEF